MNILLKNITLVDPASALDGKSVDVLIREGVYERIGNALKADGVDEGLDCTGLHMSGGWFDMRSAFGEPGAEQKETIRSGQQAAAAGGFTGVLLMPTTSPPLQSASDISFVKGRASQHAVEVYPCGVMTDGGEGKDVSGMYDMRLAGAAAFTDGKRWVRDSGLMLRLMQYAEGIGARLISYMDDPGLTAKRSVNESSNTVVLGMKGMPPVAEKIALQRDLNLIDYTGIPLHISGISTAESVLEIARAKAAGMPVTAEVYAYHLLLDDSELGGFDSLLKTMPPLRSVSDVEALRKAVLDGTIDVVCSDHAPHEVEVKSVEFDFAAFGMIGLESCFSVLNTAFDGQLPLQRLVDVLVTNPRRILGLPVPLIREGETANFTVFNRSGKLIFSEAHIASRSSNSPLIGRPLQGYPVLCGNNGYLHRCPQGHSTAKN
ncbi:MAG: dihydroorotase [Bacteroidota bacterium]